MTRLSKQKRQIDKPLIIAASSVALVLALPVLMYVLQQQQTLKQHAQMTPPPPPPPPGCYYEPAQCSTPPMECDPSNTKCERKICDPSSYKVICTYTLSPSPSATIQTRIEQTNPFTQLVHWFTNLF